MSGCVPMCIPSILNYVILSFSILFRADRVDSMRIGTQGVDVSESILKQSYETNRSKEPIRGNESLLASHLAAVLLFYC